MGMRSRAAVKSPKGPGDKPLPAPRHRLLLNFVRSRGPPGTKAGASSHIPALVLPREKSHSITSHCSNEQGRKLSNPREKRGSYSQRSLTQQTALLRLPWDPGHLGREPEPLLSRSSFPEQPARPVLQWELRAPAPQVPPLYRRNSTSFAHCQQQHHYRVHPHLGQCSKSSATRRHFF